MSRLRLIPYAVLTAGGLLAASGGANAQSMYEINRIQDQQQNRIERGINSGQITRSEAARLEAGERAIDRAQSRAMAVQGRVTGDRSAEGSDPGRSYQIHRSKSSVRTTSRTGPCRSFKSSPSDDSRNARNRGVQLNR